MSEKSQIRGEERGLHLRKLTVLIDGGVRGKLSETTETHTHTSYGSVPFIERWIIVPHRDEKHRGRQACR